MFVCTFSAGQRSKIKECLLQAAVTFLNTSAWLAKSVIHKNRQIGPFWVDED